jgi:hypothetical protein
MRSPGPNRIPSASIQRLMASTICCQVPSRSQPGAAMIPGVTTTRLPAASTASTTASL